MPGFADPEMVNPGGIPALGFLTAEDNHQHILDTCCLPDTLLIKDKHVATFNSI